MSRYELYFRDQYFRDIVDNYVIKHRTTYIGAFNSQEISKKYDCRICSLNHIEYRRPKYERV